MTRAYSNAGSQAIMRIKEIYLIRFVLKGQPLTMLRLISKYLFLLKIVSDPDTYIRFIPTTYMSSQLKYVMQPGPW